jgi:hypothetical protein
LIVMTADHRKQMGTATVIGILLIIVTNARKYDRLASW